MEGNNLESPQTTIHPPPDFENFITISDTTEE